MATILTGRGGPVEATSNSLIPWQQALKLSIRSGRQLCEYLRLPADTACDSAAADFPVFVPWEYAGRMQPGDPTDPLLRQVLATGDELMSDPAGKLDPVGDLSAERTAGLLQKYHGRVLMIMTGACAVHCRYCFRRHFPYSNAPKGRDGWLGNLQMIASDPSIEEVILSGGDPLTLADESLRWLVVQLNGIPHIRRIRLHTRLPVVIPQRVCGELEQWIKESNAAIFVVLHFNHAQEVDSRVTDALRRLHSSGATLLNQSVLLRGVNDTFEAQRELCLQLVNQRVLPYYLHLLDPVQGGMHFTVPDAEGQKIIEQLRYHLPGYAVPTLVREIAGQPSKTPI